MKGEEIKAITAGFQDFESFQQWVNKASSWIDKHAICFDAKGRRCRIGKDFMLARDEGAFPVFYTWDKEEADEAMSALRALAGGK